MKINFQTVFCGFCRKNRGGNLAKAKPATNHLERKLLRGKSYVIKMEERLFKYIEKTVYKVTGKKGLCYDTDFVKDLELTSFDVMNIVCEFEDHFDVDIPSRDVWKLHQVKDVIAYMIRKGITDV